MRNCASVLGFMIVMSKGAWNSFHCVTFVENVPQIRRRGAWWKRRRNINRKRTHATPSKETWTAMVMGDVMLSYLGHPSSLHIKTLRRTPREDPSHHLKELGSDLGQEDEDRSISEGRRWEKTRGDRERQEVMAGGRGGAGRFPGAPRQGTSYSEGGGIQNGLSHKTNTNKGSGKGGGPRPAAAAAAANHLARGSLAEGDTPF